MSRPFKYGYSPSGAVEPADWDAMVDRVGALPEIPGDYSFKNGASYVIWYYDGHYYANDEYHTVFGGPDDIGVDGGDYDAVVQAVLTALTGVGGSVYLKELAFNVDLTIPDGVTVIQVYNGQMRFFTSKPDYLSKPSLTLPLSFKRYSHNPIVRHGAVGEWDVTNVADPSIVEIPSGNFAGLVMFFFGYNGITAKIGFATSNDGSLTSWTKYAGNPILTVGAPASWDETGVHKPCAVISGDQVYLFYSGVGGLSYRIGLAVSGHSFDLTTWNKYGSNPIITDGTYADAPEVVYNPADKKYYLFYYAVVSGNGAVKYATSDDLLTWSVQGVALSGSNVEGNYDCSILSVAVIQLPSGLWMMVFNGSNATGVIEELYGTTLGLAFSTDLKTWIKYDGNPVVDYDNAQTWDSRRIYAPALLLRNNTIHLYYNAEGLNEAEVIKEQIGLAYSSAIEPYSRVNLDRGLAVHFPFDEVSGAVAFDISGYRNDGTVTTASFSSSGKYEGCISFPGTQADVTASSAVTMKPVSGLTITAWIKPNIPASGNNKWGVIAASTAYGATENGDFEFRYITDEPNGNFLVFKIYHSGSSSLVTTEFQVSNSEWHFVVAVWDGVYMWIYVDGVRTAYGTALSVALPASSHDFTIGNLSAADTEEEFYYKGLIDDLRFYRRGLSLAEHTTLFHLYKEYHE